jgi:hypothetical protein
MGKPGSAGLGLSALFVSALLLSYSSLHPFSVTADSKELTH